MSTEFQYPVKITWKRSPKWNQICAWGIEHFGLPGSRYITHADETCMTWQFSSQQDQLLFALAWGDDR
jgi:hypothetical protein